ncbi:hypothetical protein CVT24_005671, partial [Panaeolus cyanescens]
MEPEDLDAVFIEDHWIKNNKRFHNVPLCVHDALETRLKIPDIILQKFPSPQLSVIELLNAQLPRISTEIISTKPHTWFSEEAASPTATDQLWNWPTPSKDILDSLLSAVGQAWFDGATSIIDQRLNQSTSIRFPLWVFTFWKDVMRYTAICQSWKNAVSWLEHEKQQITTNLSVIQEAETMMLSLLPGCCPMFYCRNTTQIEQLARFLGTRWLATDHIDMLMEKLQKDLSKKQSVHSSTNPQ